jgi:uncharacterized membrane protein YeaQ/YmgE (transglycosylase-associated protein family)
VRALRYALVALYLLSLAGAVIAAAIGSSRDGGTLASDTFRIFILAAVGALATLTALTLFERRLHG